FPADAPRAPMARRPSDKPLAHGLKHNTNPQIIIALNRRAKSLRGLNADISPARGLRANARRRIL
ncbi:MAG: hypothetical protein WD076_09120, partial [Parvularculaceae bacterium]